ncbi:hypothetical protein AB0912_02325 [Streptomyces sp. NPDC007084]|uniref:hypothetical protein n=1 Tax=Streptomyces sp. NPDC007084 TaxID=3154313 RepID=UPI003451EC90
MNRRPRLLATAAVGATAVLLLTACGGSDGESKANDKIAGADTGSSAPASPSASASASVDAGRPKIVFPSDARNVFEGQKTGDAKKDAVLADNAERVNSIDDAIFRGRVNTEALGFYSAQGALDSARSFVRGYLDHNHSWTGITRYFDREVSFRSDGSAVVVYCSDESKSFLKDRKTNKRENTPTSADSYVLYNTKLVKNADGVWQTTNVISKRGADQCQP